jgi:hypothetical protein
VFNRFYRDKKLSVSLCVFVRRFTVKFTGKSLICSVRPFTTQRFCLALLQLFYFFTAVWLTD